MPKNIPLTLPLRNPLFAHLTKERFEAAFPPDQLTQKSYQAGQWIHREKETCHYFEVILKGQVAIEKGSPRGDVQRVTVLKAPQTLGDSLLFAQDKSYPMDVVCLRAARILSIPPQLLLDLGQKDRVFLEKFLSSVTQKTSILSKRIARLSLHTIRQTIWLDLLSWQKTGQKTLLLPYTKEEWAKNIGCARTSLSRELQKMKEEGLISYKNRRFTLHHPPTDLG